MSVFLVFLIFLVFLVLRFCVCSPFAICFVFLLLVFSFSAHFSAFVAFVFETACVIDLPSFLKLPLVSPEVNALGRCSVLAPVGHRSLPFDFAVLR